MRKRINSGIIVAFTTILSAGLLKAQVPDTVKEKETIIIRDDAANRNVAASPATTESVYDKTYRDVRKLHKVELGLRFMPTFSSLKLRSYNGEVVRGDATMSIGYGAFLGVNFSKNVGLQAEVNYNEISQKYKDRNLDRQVNINYLNVPILLSLNTDKTRMVNWNVVAGPQFGFNVGSNSTTGSSGETDNLHAEIAVKQNDVGLAYGTGLDFMLNKSRTIRLDLGYRGFYGLISGKTDSSGDNTYNVLVRASRKAHGGYGGVTFLF